MMVLLTFSYSITALAAPKKMSDGQMFDAEYYAEHNPDVVKALGTAEDVLYKHYVEHGKAEGRLPYANASNTTSSLTTSAKNANNTATSNNTTSQTVYITRTGEKYHRANCRYLSTSSIKISLSDAISGGYTACKVCKP